MKERICRECKQAMQPGEKLKGHWRAKHAEKWNKIQSWLGEDEGKLKAAEILAAEGMQGYHAGAPIELGILATGRRPMTVKASVVKEEEI